MKNSRMEKYKVMVFLDFLKDSVRDHFSLLIKKKLIVWMLSISTKVRQTFVIDKFRNFFVFQL